MSRGIEHRTEEVFDRFFNDSDSDIGYLSPEYESEDDILVSNWSGTGDFDNLPPPPPTQRRAGKNKTAGPTSATKGPNAPHQNLAN